ncbi:hypothetical protein ASPZODRAFT_139213 [Penicilliopsis zonata CBS 506.65]|uniref:Nuclear RNA binding protein n=1 Tax=Penicilliopsis zonata CBS 506.65 TaxID=1073090 RepID=A0A1L9SRL3_9EURO|nr:hypothetical protein ASPZODRAFT_139213 [Penicilliopsis zonata CBS 506.65]OJJ49860.1 hypothetical protein ASPZODRAFT_139213 [Penicilliopsis zonata CBS 506.65]
MAEVTLDTDPLRADLQLQQTLQLTETDEPESPVTHRDEGYHDGNESWVASSESGRFDDAEEFFEEQEDVIRKQDHPHHHVPVAEYSPSAKRRRSNDWPLQEDKNEPRRRVAANNNSTSYRWSPRSGRRAASGSASAGRRSRFIEASMNDSVSEKPPSIFLRDEAQHQHQQQQRASGVFRFGKALVSAFNPFGVWSNVSDIWRGPHASPSGAGAGNPDTRNADDTLARAERAYAELKKAGYKGTIKGSYLQDHGTSSEHPPPAQWSAAHSRQSSAATETQVGGSHRRHDSGSSSIRSSLHDLRRAKSALGTLYSGRGSEESDRTGVRKQQSRKDLLRQEKLLKKVSNLEEKLERARRELRELARGEDVDMADQREIQRDNQRGQTHTYPRRFVPGALPSLPSERLLDAQAADMEISEPSTPQPMALDSPSRKRKSPEVSRKSPKQAQPHHHNNKNNNHTTPRRHKLQKHRKDDSPGSVERQHNNPDQTPSDDESHASKYLRPPRSSSSVGRASASTTALSPGNNGPTPCLRMKKGRMDLRAGSNPTRPLYMHTLSSHDLSTTLCRDEQEHENHQHDDQNHSFENNDDDEHDDDDVDDDDDDIPPVPPLPKELAGRASPVKKKKKKGKGLTMTGPKDGKENKHVDEFQWPDDIF